MSRARRKWEQDLIAAAALMGAVFEEVVISRRSFRGPVPSGERIRKAWAVSIYDSEQRGVFFPAYTKPHTGILLSDIICRSKITASLCRAISTAA